MGTYAVKRIQKAFDRAFELTVGNLSRIVIISDCHRGKGDNVDNFARNKNIYHTALSHYYKGGFTCIELGDGDELWENKNFSDIVESNADVFELLSKFYEQNRLYMVYGNHDIVKKNEQWVKDNMFMRYDSRKKQLTPLFPNIKVHEAIVLKHKHTDKKLFLLHGHQADFFNDTLYRLSQFLVRYFWSPLETIGVTNPTSAAYNNDKKRLVEKNFIRWLAESDENSLLVAGHTHRCTMAKPDEPAYLNSGSCVRAGEVTAIEIQFGMLCLVRWNIHARDDGVLFVARKIIDGPEPLEKYFLA